MNSKMTINSQLSTAEPKNQPTNQPRKHLEQEQNHRNGDHMEGYQWGGEGGNGEKSTGIKKHNWQVQNRQGEVKNCLGNREAKAFICMTHGCELRVSIDGGNGGAGQRETKGENGTTVIA